MDVLSAGIFSGTAAEEQDESTAICVVIASSRLSETRSWGDSVWMTTEGKSTELWPSKSREQMLDHRPDPLRLVARPETPWTPRLLQEAGPWLVRALAPRAGRETQVVME